LDFRPRNSVEDPMIGRFAIAATTLLLLGGAAQAALPTAAPNGLSNDLRVLAQAAGSTVTVRTAYANLRAEPTTKSPKVGEVKQGQKLEVIKTEGDWVQIKQGDKTPYVNRKLLNAK
jgi:uncharacterized protein YgiM (DUF1202 family)